MSTVLEVGQTDFVEKALNAKGLVIVDFSAKWCGPCKRMLPELEATAAEFAGRATFITVDVDEAPEVAMRFGVQGVPNMTFLRDGQVIDTVIGAMPRAAIAARVSRLLTETMPS